MKPTSILLLLAGGLLFSPAARAEVQVIWDRNPSREATAAFKFPRVPAPATNDAATNARIHVVAGEVDGHSGDIETLQDGSTPTHEDQPAASLFFAQGTNGGRLVIDLGAVTGIQQVRTYSWHPNTRGPQVYRLYASDGAAPRFQMRPARGFDPDQAGWKRLASIDTRSPDSEPGGQYGVNIVPAGGGVLGQYRYLLFDISRTEHRDPFGNTFFSEIDVSDGREHAAAPVDRSRCDFSFDASEVPELQEWVDTQLRPVCEEWYPRIVALLPSNGYRPPRRCTVVFRRDMRGVAHTAGTQVVCAGPWFRQNRDGEALGAVVHELVHVVQRYHPVAEAEPQPGWLVEGVADYIRWFLYEPAALRPRPDPARAKYTDSYRTTAAFLSYLVETHDRELVRKLNAALREGRYRPDLWKMWLGKTAEELWVEYVRTLTAG